MPLLFLKNTWGASFKHIYILFFFTRAQHNKNRSEPKEIFDPFIFHYTIAHPLTLTLQLLLKYCASLKLIPLHYPTVLISAI